MRNFERSATLLPSSPTLQKIPRAPLLAHNLLLCRLRRSKHRNELRISHDDRLLQFWEKKTKTPHYLPFSQNLSYFIFQTFSRSGKLVRQFQDVFKNPRLPSTGKSGFISWNYYGFAIERIKRISLPRNPSSTWILNYEIQIRIFCISFFTACLGNPKKRICKTVSWTVVFFLL